MYNEKVLKHFQNPSNNVELKDPDAVGVAANPTCGDVIKLFLKIGDGIIQEATFKTMGCGGSIASGSILTELIRGKKLDEVKNLEGRAISEALGGLPSIKMHCPDLAAEALKNALNDYQKKSQTNHSHTGNHKPQGHSEPKAKNLSGK